MGAYLLQEPNTKLVKYLDASQSWDKHSHIKIYVVVLISIRDIFNLKSFKLILIAL